jgi:hypothetical protein
MRNEIMKIAAACGAAFLLSASASAAALFSDDFETGTLVPNWLLKGGTPPNEGAVVSDPLFTTHSKVLTFNTLNAGGSIVSASSFTGSPAFTIEFDYLGLASPSGKSVADDFGGFLGVGILSGDPGDFWLAGTQAGYSGAFGPVVHLIDDNTWHHYSVTFATPVALSGELRIMIEDFSGSGGVPGDAHFDNISITAVPEPSTYAMLLAGLGLMGFMARRRMRS